MFSALSEKLQLTFKKLRSKGKLRETDIAEALRDVRMALLEADVNLKVIKEFIEKVKNQAVGVQVIESLTPVQHIIKIVYKELTSLMGEKYNKISMSSNPPTIIMMVGLQGSGKTITSIKLAKELKKQGKNPLVVAADIYRLAAIKQLQVLGEKTKIHVFQMGNKVKPQEITVNALKYAAQYACDIIIIDTAGRMHIDEILMQELLDIKSCVKPHEILLVIDAITGQDAINIAETFNKKLDITGMILTKLDGDARGGAALSAKAITGKPIKYIGISEKVDGIEQFHPERMASRILGMGDILSLVEKAEVAFDEKNNSVLENKLRKQEFTLDDLLDQLQNIKKMGSLSQIMRLIPGIGSKLAQCKHSPVDNSQVVKIEAIIHSMTLQEKRKPEIMNAHRKQRVAKGSGTDVQDINRLLNQFESTKKMMKKMVKVSGKNFKGIPKIFNGF